MIPRIAIPEPTSTDAAYNQRSWSSYADAVSRSGGEPVKIDLRLPQVEIQAVMQTCHGVCLPGSPADVNPDRYAAHIDPATSAADLSREAGDIMLLEDAYKHRKPILAICFGVQFMNVWRGGTLVQDLAPLPVNHAAGRKVAVAHTILIAEHSMLGQLLLENAETRAEAPLTDGYLRLPVNTSHHQAVSAPGEGLSIVARCPEDGVVEAIEGVAGDRESTDSAPFFVLGVQWHPERSYDISATSRAMFAHLIQRASMVTL